MTTLLDTLNITREETLSLHYRAAMTELQEHIKNKPLTTKYDIFSGCVSFDIATEIAHRFNSKGVKTTLNKTGLLKTTYYLTIDLSLPDNLTHK